jgi:hypothetical protein
VRVADVSTGRRTGAVLEDASERATDAASIAAFTAALSAGRDKTQVMSEIEQGIAPDGNAVHLPDQLGQHEPDAFAAPVLVGISDMALRARPDPCGRSRMR